MKNIYFVQVGFSFGSDYYLPYAAGALIAYAQRNERIKTEYCFKNIFFKRDVISEIVLTLENPYLVSFSNYIWNFEYNKALAKKIKECFPECLILFGGHNVSEDSSLLEKESYIDLLMFGEGEEPFTELLLALFDNDISTVCNIAYRAPSVTVNPRKTFASIDNYPSAMLSGVFDEIIDNNPEISFLGVLETNRGCPYNCAYCDWCAGRRVRKFPMERIKAEIAWMAAHKIEYCFCADANFGLFERDLEIVDAIVESKQKTGYPKVFRLCYAKESGDRVFKICSRLNEFGMDKGATMAYQTLSDSALENINRKNLTMDHFSSLLSMYNKAGIPSYSELILGLPGETYESFSRGICSLLEAGQHNSVSVYYCEMLPNSPMSVPEYIEKHKIKSLKVPFNHIHSSAVREDVEEFSNIIVSTATMPREDWVRCNRFSVCVQAFHNLGLLRFIAVYLRQEAEVSYYDFYKSLLEYLSLHTDSLAGGFIRDMTCLLESDEGRWNYSNPNLGDAEWFFEEGLFIDCIFNSELFFAEIKPFAEQFFNDKVLFESLYKYQKDILRKPNRNKFSVVTDYDFEDYFKNAFAGQKIHLKKLRNEIFFEFNESTDSPADYAREIVWYGRRRGATLATGGKKKFML